ncbi:hypothetical protein YDYSG_35750 [Paenibacillus tyrfis]|uniref:hypothetical protein n=1 Tax=Paenibacillus TaxID=44249 RepID=UPI002492B631|nr:hypothetical protein [Paenibacillus tyrfis]GLI07545.1 hypothetical protein YDYSG_35750 [Paenibacillus tyrfis]GMX62414.1 hypothetical protein Elgi_22190 [Paenibacillus elgii]
MSARPLAVSRQMLFFVSALVNANAAAEETDNNGALQKIHVSIGRETGKRTPCGVLSNGE